MAHIIGYSLMGISMAPKNAICFTWAVELVP
jgi:hypothetical protein